MQRTTTLSFFSDEAEAIEAAPKTVNYHDIMGVLVGGVAAAYEEGNITEMAAFTAAIDIVHDALHDGAPATGAVIKVELEIDEL